METVRAWTLALRSRGQQAVFGLTPEACVYYAFEWARAHPETPAIVVVPSLKRLHEAREYVALFKLLHGADVDDVYFPEVDTKFHLHLQPDVQRDALRARALLALTHGVPGPRLFVTTPWALSHATPDLATWKNNVVEVQAHDLLDRTDLEASLIQSGYTRESVVENVGEFSVRGFTIDIFSPSHDHPLRIECFDDEVESIRTFHPESQRTETDFEKVFIPPLRLCSLGSKLDKNAETRLRAVAESFGIPKPHREWVLTAIRNSSFFKGIDGLTRILFENPQPFSARLPPNAQFFIADPDAAAGEIPNTVTEIRRGLEGVTPEVASFRPFQEDVATLERWPEILVQREVLELHGLVTQPGLSAVTLKSSGVDHIRGRLNPATPLLFDEKVKRLRDLIGKETAEGNQVVFAASGESQSVRLRHLVGEDITGVRIINHGVPRGFSLASANLVLLTEEEVFGRRRKPVAAKKTADPGAGLELKPGDFVAHQDHGVGKFLGLKTMTFGSLEAEFLILEFRDNDLLYVPVDRLNVVSKFAESDRKHVEVDKLGSGRWEKVKQKARKSILDVAAKLMDLYAQRKLARAPVLKTSDEEFERFCAEFPYEETPDQDAAIGAVRSDLMSEQPTDRLVCGDVGFGKTEVAMRAAFLAVSTGAQVVVLVPTTLLCLQHESTFRNRFKSFPVRVESLSRFQLPKEEKRILAELKEGKVDIVIGTHRLLSKDVALKNLGLLVIDEEQRFGVTHKERLRQLRAEVHTLTLTATPIPRTLHLSLMGLRDLSLINTPPQDRLSVRTYVCTFDEGIMREAIESELARHGQIFVVTPRVMGIEELAQAIREWAPQARIIVAHGQLPEAELEKRMIQFYKREADVLIATTIIESGLDVPNANTLIVCNSDRFGLAQLYQLRGRIGRSNVRAYCYLTVENMKLLGEEGKKRLHVLQNHSDLGSGLTVAHYDLDLRGAGDILGDQQSGHLQTLGLEAYLELLEEAVCQLRNQPLPPPEPDIRIKAVALFPEAYIPDVLVRMRLYRRLAKASSLEDLDALSEEIRDRFGPLPEEGVEMLRLSQCRFLARRLDVLEITGGARKIAFRFSPQGLTLRGDHWLSLVKDKPKNYAALPDGRLIRMNVPELCTLTVLFEELTALWERAGRP